MDNTELHYVTYDPDAIWQEMQMEYITQGGDVLYPGDEKEMLLRSVQADIVQVLAGVDNALRMQTLRYAIGEYLDEIGALRGCERIQAEAAVATVSIVTNATGTAGTIPAGTLFTADGETFYALDSDISLSGAAQAFSATVTAAEAGTAGNGLTAGTEMVPYIANPAINSVTVLESATGGEDEEEDDVYRERIRQHTLTAVTTGTAAQYESVARATSGYVLDARALNVGAGAVNIYLALSDDSDSPAILAAVLAAVSADDVKPLSDTVTVSEAEEKAYTLYVRYASEGTSSISAALADAVTEYQEWQTTKIGRAFNPDKLKSLLYQAGATRVEWWAGSEFDGSSVIEYTEIPEDCRCVGTIELSEG